MSVLVLYLEVPSIDFEVSWFFVRGKFRLFVTSRQRPALRKHSRVGARLAKVFQSCRRPLDAAAMAKMKYT